MKPPEIKEKAASLVAESICSRRQIAAECGISVRCLDNWNSTATFQDMVNEHRAKLKSVFSTGIADTTRRLFYLTDLARRCQEVLDARAKDPAMENVPGGQSGLLRRRIKSVCGRPVAEVVTDVEPVRRLQSLLKQVEAELRPVAEAQQTTPDFEIGAEPDFSALTTEESAQLVTLLQKVTGEKR